MVKIWVVGPEIKTTSWLIRTLNLKRRTNDVFLENLEGLDILDMIFNNKAQNKIKFQTKEK